MNEHEKLNYVELPARDLSATRNFFGEVFGWRFEEFGPDYCAFAGQGLDGGFYRSELYSSTQNGSALMVFYSDDLEATQTRIEQAGGRIEKPIFEFPGGRRFHFCEPSGNEFAVWSAPAAVQAAGK
ncbi:MAG: VOC family protein [Gammaproteobacteria bacterium]|nr:VOC family protein [Gammaproteobacteria bacterium]